MRHRTQHGRRSLLGEATTPTLRLVGTAGPQAPPGPTNWISGRSPSQYGVDYAFGRRAGRLPVRWPADLPITVRLHSAEDEQLCGDADAVVGELRELTGLRLRMGHYDDTRIIDGSIMVRRVPDWIEHPFRSGATGVDQYRTGLVVLPMGPVGRTVLRHALGHALGLGHVYRIGEVMAGRADARGVTYGPGDRHGLHRLGDLERSRRTPT